MRGLFIAFPLALASVAFAGPISIPTLAAPSTPDFTAMPRMTAASASASASAAVVAAPTTTTAAPVVTAHTTLITMASELEPRKHKHNHNNHHQHDKDHYGYGGCFEYWDGRLITNCPSVIATT